MELLACSGPGAGAAIAKNTANRYAHAAVAGGLLLTSALVLVLGSRRWLVPAILLGLLILHPAWTISGLGIGDCGMLRRDVSWLFTGLGVVALGWQVGRHMGSRRWRAPTRGAAEPLS